MLLQGGTKGDPWLGKFWEKANFEGAVQENDSRNHADFLWTC